MSMDLINRFLLNNRNKSLNIHCVGDAMVDEYYRVKVNRISPEFPMPIMSSTNDVPIKRPGGVANVAYQFKNFNVLPTLICFADSDALKVFHEHGVHRFWNRFEEKTQATLPIKKRFLDGKVQIKRHDIEKPFCGLSSDEIDQSHFALKKAVNKLGMNPNVVIFSDYNKGFFYPEAKVHFPSIYPNAKIIVDPKKGPINRWRGCTILKLNSSEAENLSGKIGWKEQAKFLKKELACEAVVITFSGDKVAGMDKNGYFLFNPDEKVNVDSVVGAGDCFAAIFAMAIGYGFTVRESVEVAYRAGSIYVQANMNRPIVPAELSYSRVVCPEDLASRDFKIVFMNAYFESINKNSIDKLKTAKNKGDKLVVGINLNKKNKLIPNDQKIEILSNLRFVDFVVPYKDDNPIITIQKIKPDVIVS